jgi:hypothetical protein
MTPKSSLLNFSHGFLAGTTAVIACSVALWSWKCIHRLKKDAKSEHDAEDWRDDDVDVVESFPWEPKSKDPPYSFKEKFLEDTKKPQHDTSKKQHLEQLEFLSSMSFANGGLRAPTCPCCF